MKEESKEFLLNWIFITTGCLYFQIFAPKYNLGILFILLINPFITEYINMLKRNKINKVR